MKANLEINLETDSRGSALELTHDIKNLLESQEGIESVSYELEE